MDTDDPDKDLDALDIALPRLTRRFNREFKDLDELDPASFGNPKLPIKAFTPEETREIVFKTMLDAEVDHTIQLDGSGPADYRSVVGFFARQLLKDLRLVGGYDQLYPKVKTFMRDHLFTSRRRPGRPGDPAQPVRAGGQQGAVRPLPRGDQRADDPRKRQRRASRAISGCATRAPSAPSRAASCRRSDPCSTGSSARRSADGLELAFAAFLETAPDVQAFGKNYMAVGFKIDYVKADGELSTYTPDFIVRTTDGAVWIVETKGREELDLPQKMARLRQWCADATEASEGEGGPRYGFVYVDQESFEQHKPSSFAGLAGAFREYQEG